MLHLISISHKRVFLLILLHGLSGAAAVYTHTMPALVLFVSLLLAAVLIALSEIDFASHRIPDVFSFGLLAAGLTVTYVLNPEAVLLHISAALGGFTLFALISFLYFRLKGYHGLGLGDAKLFAACGAWLGPLALPSVLLIGCLSALIFVIIYWLCGQKEIFRERIAFGPFLAFGLWLVWLFGPLQ